MVAWLSSSVLFALYWQVSAIVLQATVARSDAASEYIDTYLALCLCHLPVFCYMWFVVLSYYHMVNKDLLEISPGKYEKGARMDKVFPMVRYQGRGGEVVTAPPVGVLLLMPPPPPPPRSSKRIEPADDKQTHKTSTGLPPSRSTHQQQQQPERSGCRKHVVLLKQGPAGTADMAARGEVVDSAGDGSGEYDHYIYVYTDGTGTTGQLLGLAHTTANTGRQQQHSVDIMQQPIDATQNVLQMTQPPIVATRQPVQMSPAPRTQAQRVIPQQPVVQSVPSQPPVYYIVQPPHHVPEQTLTSLPTQHVYTLGSTVPQQAAASKTVPLNQTLESVVYALQPAPHIETQPQPPRTTPVTVYPGDISWNKRRRMSDPQYRHANEFSQSITDSQQGTRSDGIIPFSQAFRDAYYEPYSPSSPKGKYTPGSPPQVYAKPAHVTRDSSQKPPELFQQALDTHFKSQSAARDAHPPMQREMQTKPRGQTAPESTKAGMHGAAGASRARRSSAPPHVTVKTPTQYYNNMIVYDELDADHDRSSKKNASLEATKPTIPQTVQFQSKHDQRHSVPPQFMQRRYFQHQASEKIAPKVYHTRRYPSVEPRHAETINPVKLVDSEATFTVGSDTVDESAAEESTGSALPRIKAYQDESLPPHAVQNVR